MTHPHYWPYVRRGAEREAHDLARGLVDRGHQVRILTGAPSGPPVARRWVDGIGVTYLRVPALGALTRRGWTPELVFGLAALPVMLARTADLVHALHYADAWAATRARHRRPVVLKLTGTVLPDRLAQAPRPNRRALRGALDAADEVWVNSAYARDVMAGFGREMQVVPAGVDLQRFVRRDPRDDEVVVACTASPAEPRKRVVEVIEAWPAVAAQLPGARLVLAGEASAPLQRELLQSVPARLRPGITFAGRLDEEPLRRLYERSHATVAPARYEALGLATLESLAVGTPVAGANSGATPELVGSGIGAVFEPGDTEGCAAAIVESVALASQPGIEQRCRAAAEPYGWERLLDDIAARHVALAGR